MIFGDIGIGIQVDVFQYGIPINLNFNGKLHGVPPIFSDMGQNLSTWPWILLAWTSSTMAILLASPGYIRMWPRTSGGHIRPITRLPVPSKVTSMDEFYPETDDEAPEARRPWSAERPVDGDLDSPPRAAGDSGFHGAVTVTKQTVKWWWLIN